MMIPAQVQTYLTTLNSTLTQPMMEDLYITGGIVKIHFSFASNAMTHHIIQNTKPEELHSEN